MDGQLWEVAGEHQTGVLIRQFVENGKGYDMKPPRWLRSHIQKVGAAYANRISSPNKDDSTSEPETAKTKAQTEDYGEFSCKLHQEQYKEMCRQARGARESGDTKNFMYWMDKADDFDKRKGIGRHQR